jgi:hypothetical protein
MVVSRWSILVVVACMAVTAGWDSVVGAAELSRTIPVTDTVKDDIEQHRAAMASELKGLGCEKAHLTGFTSPTNPSLLVLVMTCTQDDADASRPVSGNRPTGRRRG